MFTNSEECSVVEIALYELYYHNVFNCSSALTNLKLRLLCCFCVSLKGVIQRAHTHGTPRR
jgi:hypothetical protein